MDHASPHTLESATGNLVHLLKEGFLPFCITDGRGGVAVLLVEDRESFAILTRESQRLLNAGASILDLHRRALVEKLWFDLGSVASADHLARRIAILLEQQTA